MIARLVLLVFTVSLGCTSCKDKPVQAIPDTLVVDTVATKEFGERTRKDLARIYGVSITRSGDTLLPRIPKDSIQRFLLAYGKDNLENRVRMNTKHGTIELELFNDMPLERASFIFLVKHNFFSHSVVHRVVQNFVVQAGNSDNRITAMKRSSIGNYRLPPNYNPKYKHVRGMLSLAKQWENNPTDAHDPFEFFISLGTAPHLNGKHTIFGRVSSGMDVADLISKEPTDQGDWPLKEVYIEMSVE
jgi:peptidylprolyl isomerase